MALQPTGRGVPVLTRVLNSIRNSDCKPYRPTTITWNESGTAGPALPVASYDLCAF